jgi:hypothetical protein
VMAVRRPTRAPGRVASQKQQERRAKQAHQDTGGCCRHLSGCASIHCSNVRGSTPTIKRHGHVSPGSTTTPLSAPPA